LSQHLLHSVEAQKTNELELPRASSVEPALVAQRGRMKGEYTHLTKTIDTNTTCVCALQFYVFFACAFVATRAQALVVSCCGLSCNATVGTVQFPGRKKQMTTRSPVMGVWRKSPLGHFDPWALRTTTQIHHTKYKLAPNVCTGVKTSPKGTASMSDANRE